MWKESFFVTHSLKGAILKQISHKLYDFGVIYPVIAFYPCTICQYLHKS